MTAPRPYQVCLYVGASAPKLPEVRVVDLTPADGTPAAVLDALRNSGLTPADLRARVLFLADGGPEQRDAALMMYAALLGFAKRRLDIGFGLDREALAMDDFDETLRRMPDAGRPDVLDAQAQVGGAPRTDLPFIDVSAGFSAATVSAIRYARRLRFVPPAAIAEALPQLVAVAALRARGATEKLPYLCTGEEPALGAAVTGPANPVPGPVAGLGGADAVGICLDTIRRDAEELRRSLRSDNREAIAEPAELGQRQQRLLQADAVPVAQTLSRLGAGSKTVAVDPKPGTPEFETGEKVAVEMWHCPRPQRHNRGDANPSARIHAKTGHFQCFRCDRERIGSLRLVMDSRGLSADEAADWLLTD